MPIKIPNSLPAREILEGENIFVMTEYRAIHQDIRPLKLLILNLMPTKIATETQLLRKFSNTPLQTQVELLQMSSHTSHNTDADHLSSFCFAAPAPGGIPYSAPPESSHAMQKQEILDWQNPTHAAPAGNGQKGVGQFLLSCPWFSFLEKQQRYCHNFAII